jgi:CBS domain-containing protein
MDAMSTQSAVFAREATCEAVMDRAPLTLSPDDRIAQGLHLLLRHHLLALPVVDGDGRYRGMFLKSRLIARLLPAGATGVEAMHPISQMPDIGFIQLSVDDLRASFRSLADQPVAALLDVGTPVFRPDSPLSSALLQLYRTRNFVPVVTDDGRLVGMISTWNILARLEPAAAG